MKLVEGFDSNYRYILVAARRARQLQGGAPPVIVMPGIDTIRVRGSGLFRLGHSYIAEELDVLRDIRALLYWKEPPERRRVRNGWPVPDRTVLGSGAWTIGE